MHVAEQRKDPLLRPKLASAEFYDKLEKGPAWTVRPIECGHDAMLDEPEQAVNILREAAEITLTKF
jgi:hypothetical protein